MQSKILAAEEESHSEDSEHGAEWEKQQILKGTGTLAPMPGENNTQNGSYGKRKFLLLLFISGWSVWLYYLC